MNFRELNMVLPGLRIVQELNLPSHSYTREMWRGRCPYHHSPRLKSRSLAISLVLRKFLCHKCGAHGDLIDLWAHVRNVTLPVAAQELRDRFL